MKYTSTGNGYHLADFPSLSAYVDFCMHPDNGLNRKGSDPTFDSHLANTETRRAFSQNMNCQDAAAMLENPPPTADLIHLLADTLNLSAHDQPRRRLRRGLEDGADLDPIGWVNRRPDSWEDIRSERTQKKIFRLMINISTSCGETPENLISRAAAALSLVDAAEKAGHRCELDGLIVIQNLDTRKTRRNGETQVIRIRLKSAEAPADLDTLALAAGELGFFRTMGLRGMLACYNGEKNISEGLGWPDKAPAHLTRDYDTIIDREIHDRETALAFIKKFEAGHLHRQEDSAHA